MKDRIFLKGDDVVLLEYAFLQVGVELLQNLLLFFRIVYFGYEMLVEVMGSNFMLQFGGN